MGQPALKYSFEEKRGLEKAHLTYGDFVHRFGAYFVDSLIFCVPIFVLGLVIQILTPDSMTGTNAEVLLGSAFGLLWLGAIIGSGLYFAYFESSEKEATPGKMIFGLKVTDLNGNSTSFGKATARYWAKMISAIPFGLGFVMPLLTEKKQALHDILVGTLVLKK